MVAIREFFETTAPNEITTIDGLEISGRSGGSVSLKLSGSETIDIYCPGNECELVRHFDRIDNRYQTGVVSVPEAEDSDWVSWTVRYRCRYCRHETKRIHYQLRKPKEADQGETATCEAAKVGEWPPFGARLPGRLVTLLRTERDLLFKAKKALNAGLGIGSFAYYRRVVESQKVALFDEIIRTGRAIGIDQAIVTELETARDERQFTRSMELGRDAIPDRLLMAGQNPLMLLHEALSEGLHAQEGEDHGVADERCLQLAGAVETVLISLVEEMHHLRTERAGLQGAIQALNDRRREP